MGVVQVVAGLGGQATRAQILRETTEHDLRMALRRGAVVRLTRGRYALGGGLEPRDSTPHERREYQALLARRAAHELHGTVVLLSAAATWGWATKWYPPRPQVAVRRGRHLTPAQRRRAETHFWQIPRSQLVDGRVTDPTRTAVDCARVLPEDEALAVLDSALRSAAVTQDDLLQAVAGLPVRHPHRSRAERLVRMADARADNPFESVLRWIVHDVPGLCVDPQVEIDDDSGRVGRVDLADVELRIVLEADSHEHHASPAALAADCSRYDRLVAAGWLVLRFTWDHVMHRPGWVREMVRRVVEIRQTERARLVTRG